MGIIIAVFLDPPQLLKGVTEVSVKVGENVVQLCTTKTGSLPMNFEWQKKNEEINSNDERYSFQTAELHSLMSIRNVNMHDTGNYTCRVSNSFGSDSYSFSIFVKGKI